MEMNWCFDVIAGLIFIGFIFQGVKKGFSKLIVHSAVNWFFVAVSFFMSGMLAETLFESFFEDSVTMYVNEAVDGFDIEENFNRAYSELTFIEEVSSKEISRVFEKEDDMDKRFLKLIKATSGVGDRITEEECCDKLNSIIKVSLQESISEKLPSYSGKYFENTDREQTFRILNLIYSDRKQAAEYITDNYIKEKMFHFVQMLSFVVSAVVLMIISNIVFSIVFRDKDMKSDGVADSILGTIPEIVNAVMVITIFAFLVKITVYSGVEINGIMDDNALNSSYIFRFMYNADKYMLNFR
ncbi:MAG: hypothetical protein MSH15_03090 [Oscillospiraceae bacterium]|nr:hypothetical protein [Oscillospiraceae bacterium]